MSRKRIKKPESFCPICDRRYEKDVKYKFCNVKTKHHLFPSYWYGGRGLKLIACSRCHTYGFHKIFPMGKKVWLQSECVNNWVKFCKYMGKDAYFIYPELKNLECLF